MFYAKYNTRLVQSPIAEFKTERERDEWVDFQDPYSKALHMTPKHNNPRCKVSNKAIINSIAQKQYKESQQDPYCNNITWYEL